MLPPIRDGKQKACFAVTEPNTGLNTTQLKTRAVDQGDYYLVNGQKVWISTAQIADKIMLLARTTRLEEVRKSSDGLSLFYTDLDRSAMSIREMRKMGRKAIDSNELFITDWKIPKRDLIGEEGRGFEYILHGMNPERVLLAAEAVGLGSLAVQTAATYAKERIVFNRPIGQNQGIQHPLAQCWMELEAAWLMTMSAAYRYDQGLSVARRPMPPSILRRRRDSRVRNSGHDAWGLRVRHRLSCGALPSRSNDPADRTDQPATHSVLHRRACTRAAEVILTRG